MVQSQANSRYVLSPNPIRIRNLAVSRLPAPYAAALSAPCLPATVSGIGYRMEEVGNRTNEVTSRAQRLVLGASGVVAGWDYDVGVSRAENRATDSYVDGYVLFDQFDAGVRSGVINPFGPSGQAGKDLINAIRVNDDARKSKGVSSAIDGKVSKSLMALAGGDLAIAVGGEVRREDTTFTPSALLLSNNIAGDRGTGSANLSATDDSRKVYSMFAELNAPLTKTLEVQLAVRHDDYSQVGSTTNPKIGIRWQPTTSLLLRASTNTGFRAPSLADLNRPTTFGSAVSFLTDPECVSTKLDAIDGCTDQYPVERRSNPELKPETSRQFALGTVWDASRQLNLSLDY